MVWVKTWMRRSPSTGLMTERAAFDTLQAENARLVALLESHGIAWRAPPAAVSQPAPPASVPEPAPAHPCPSLSTAEKVALFRRLFRGRTDVYPVRWEGKTSGKSGYAPACGNEWRAGVCEKPRVKCAGTISGLLLTSSCPRSSDRRLQLRCCEKARSGFAHDMTDLYRWSLPTQPTGTATPRFAIATN